MAYLILKHFYATKDSYQGRNRGESDLGCSDFSILDFQKIGIFRKGHNGPK